MPFYDQLYLESIGNCKTTYACFPLGLSLKFSFLMLSEVPSLYNKSSSLYFTLKVVAYTSHLKHCINCCMGIKRLENILAFSNQ